MQSSKRVALICPVCDREYFATLTKKELKGLKNTNQIICVLCSAIIEQKLGVNPERVEVGNFDGARILYYQHKPLIVVNSVLWQEYQLTIQTQWARLEADNVLKL